MFVTLFLGLLDTRTGVLSFVNSGHPAPHLRRANGETRQMRRNRVCRLESGPSRGLKTGFLIFCQAMRSLSVRTVCSSAQWVRRVVLNNAIELDATGRQQATRRARENGEECGRCFRGAAPSRTI